MLIYLLALVYTLRAKFPTITASFEDLVLSNLYPLGKETSATVSFLNVSKLSANRGAYAPNLKICTRAINLN